MLRQKFPNTLLNNYLPKLLIFKQLNNKKKIHSQTRSGVRYGLSHSHFFF